MAKISDGPFALDAGDGPFVALLALEPPELPVRDLMEDDENQLAFDDLLVTL